MGIFKVLMNPLKENTLKTSIFHNNSAIFVNNKQMWYIKVVKIWLYVLNVIKSTLLSKKEIVLNAKVTIVIMTTTTSAVDKS